VNPGEVLIPIVAISTSMGASILIVFFALLYARHKREMLSKERLAAIEKGMDVPLLDTPHSRHGSPLLSGLTYLGVGVGLTIGMRILMGWHSPWAFGLVVLFIGLAKLIHWFAGGREEWERQRGLDEELQKAYIDRLRSGVAKS
jgi:hypothetical protein